MIHRSHLASYDANTGPIIAARLREQRQKQANGGTKTRGSAKVDHESRTTCAHQNHEDGTLGQLRL